MILKCNPAGNGIYEEYSGVYKPLYLSPYEVDQRI
jgi:hypothetical protein